MSGAPVVSAATKSWWKPSLGSLKKAPLIGLLAGAAVVAPFVVGSMRSERRFKEDDVPMPKALADPLPPVLEFNPSPATMMGEMPVEGAFAKKEKLRRMGASAGIDTSSPNIITPSGVSAIDGKHVSDLNSESSKPGFNLSA